MRFHRLFIVIITIFGSFDYIQSIATPCIDDAIVVDRMLTNYDKNRLPGGGKVDVNVEVNKCSSILLL
jgi:hypothetical protein